MLLNKRGKPVKKQLTVRMTGLKTVDEHLKSGVATLQEAARLRQGAALALLELRAECGLPVTANIKQCLRVLLQRLANCGDVSKCHLTAENNVSFALCLFLFVSFAFFFLLFFLHSFL